MMTVARSGLWPSGCPATGSRADLAGVVNAAFAVGRIDEPGAGAAGSAGLN